MIKTDNQDNPESNKVVKPEKKESTNPKRLVFADKQGRVIIVQNKTRTLDPAIFEYTLGFYSTETTDSYKESAEKIREKFRDSMYSLISSDEYERIKVIINEKFNRDLYLRDDVAFNKEVNRSRQNLEAMTEKEVEELKNKNYKVLNG